MVRESNPHHCLLSLFYIKPQPFIRNCTGPPYCLLSLFYIKPQLAVQLSLFLFDCLLSLFYIKPQPKGHECDCEIYCLLSLFYIKPQQTSYTCQNGTIVFYLCSTSNHNVRRCTPSMPRIVFYLCSTSNHNHPAVLENLPQLSFISVLHQTTTARISFGVFADCLLSLFYIKPQPCRGT